MVTEESYTSRANLLDLDAIPVYKKGRKPLAAKPFGVVHNAIKDES